MNRRAIVVIGIAAVAAVGVSAHQLQTPADWKWRFDRPAEVTNTDTVSDPAKFYFVAMPPGWHMTGGPAALLYHPDYQAKGNFAVEMDVFLFPNSSDQEYGVFVGGRSLDQSSAAPVYTAFVLRRDGRASIVRRSGAAETRLLDWAANPAALAIPEGGKDDVKNVVRVEAGPADVVFSVNGKEIAKVPRASVVPEGQLGVRVGSGVNLHTSQVSVTYKLAPVRR